MIFDRQPLGPSDAGRTDGPETEVEVKGGNGLGHFDAPWFNPTTEIPFYQQLWLAANPTALDTLPGDIAANFLRMSGLPRAVLHRIWALADTKNDGTMDFKRFCIACRLVSHAQNGSTPHVQLAFQEPISVPYFDPNAPPLPTTLSEEDAAKTFSSRSAGGDIENMVPSHGNEPCFDIDTNLRERYLRLMSTQNLNSKGFMEGTAARDFLSRSQLSTEILARIWDLADQDRDGCLSPSEFCVAMQLISAARDGHAPPSALPPALLRLIVDDSINVNHENGEVDLTFVGRDGAGSPNIQRARSPVGSASPEHEEYIDRLEKKVAKTRDPKEIIRESIKADQKLTRDMADHVDRLAEELAHLTDVGIALKSQLATGKRLLQRQLKRKCEFESQVTEMRQELDALNKERRCLDRTAFSAKKDIEHYAAELSFLQGQVKDARKDIADLQTTCWAVERDVINKRRQTVDLEQSRTVTTQKFESESGLLRDQLRQLKGLRKTLEDLRRRKNDIQATHAVLQEHLRQADQDEMMLGQSLAHETAKLDAVRSDRLKAGEAKNRILEHIYAIGQDELCWQHMHHSSSNHPAGVAIHRSHVQTAIDGGSKDAKGIPSGIILPVRQPARPLDFSNCESQPDEALQCSHDFTWTRFGNRAIAGRNRTSKKGIHDATSLEDHISTVECARENDASFAGGPENSEDTKSYDASGF